MILVGQGSYDLNNEQTCFLPETWFEYSFRFNFSVQKQIAILIPSA